MEKRVLMIAYHYPPCRGSSGLQRTLSFSRDLPKYGWSPIVLTATPGAYQQTGEDQLGDIPAAVPVTRAFALDSSRHLAIRGRYVKWMALPDRWIGWILGAVPAGLRLIRQYKPKLLWSTYPIATAHLIGAILHRLTGIPWIADFRDPMTEIDPVSQKRAPDDSLLWNARSWVEKFTVKNCTRMVFVTAGALQMYMERYPEVPATRWAVIANGYDEESFATVEQNVGEKICKRGHLLLLHSGTLYPTLDRDPSAFFKAVTALRHDEEVSSSTLRVVLRASGYDDHYRTLIHQYGLEDIVILGPAIPYREALAEMREADGLLVFQGYTSNPAIPAKLYEYLRANRPIFAMVDAKGETAAMLQSANTGIIVPLDSSEQIANGLSEFLSQLRQGNAKILNPAQAQTYSREYRAQELAELLNQIAA